MEKSRYDELRARCSDVTNNADVSRMVTEISLAWCEHQINDAENNALIDLLASYTL